MATVATSNAATSAATGAQKTWQEYLEEQCRNNGLYPPVYQIESDRRGGRTAWTSTVAVHGHRIRARWWYDGQYITNSKEDAAQVACSIFQAGLPTDQKAILERARLLAEQTQKQEDLAEANRRKAREQEWNR